MNNPQGNPPLSTEPRNGTGFRIWAMLRRYQDDITDWMYEDAFERLNLVNSVTWNVEMGRARAAELINSWEHRRVVVLGQEAAVCMYSGRVKLCRANLPMIWKEYESNRFAYLPHPSGRNRWYNNPENLAAASKFLYTLYCDSRMSA